MRGHAQIDCTGPGGFAIAGLICDSAGWHQTGGELEVPNNIVLLPLVPYSPELRGFPIIASLLWVTWILKTCQMGRVSLNHRFAGTACLAVILLIYESG